MGNHAQEEPRRLSNLELHAFARALELSWPNDAIAKGVSWPAAAENTRNYRVTVWSVDAAPLSSTWIAERHDGVYRVLARPADRAEVESLLQALRELDALEDDADATIAEAQYDCRERVYQLCFTPLEDMLEGLRYERWLFRRHTDDRALSVAYIFETRRGNAYVRLPGGAILRGDPWSD